MKNVIIMDGEMYLKSIEKSLMLISVEDIEKNVILQREAVVELCGGKWYNDEPCVFK